MLDINALFTVIRIKYANFLRRIFALKNMRRKTVLAVLVTPTSVLSFIIVALYGALVTSDDA